MKNTISFLLCISLLGSCTTAEREKIVADLPPINARACYIDPDTGARICVGTDGKVINVDAEFSGK